MNPKQPNLAVWLNENGRRMVNEPWPLMCERSNYGLCWLQRKSWHGGDARVMDVLLGLMHRWRSSGDHTFPFVRRSGGISVNCQREISYDKTSGSRRWESVLPIPRWGTKLPWRQFS